MPIPISECFDQIAELDQIAETVLSDPQRTIYKMTCDLENPQTCEEIAKVLNMSARNVRYHRAQARHKVSQAHLEHYQGKFRCAVTVQQGNTAEFQTDQTAQQAILNADRKAA